MGGEARKFLGGKWGLRKLFESKRGAMKIFSRYRVGECKLSGRRSGEFPYDIKPSKNDQQLICIVSLIISFADITRADQY